MKLYIGNKNYSSWSFRVWLTMHVKGISFNEDLRKFDVENDYADFFEFSPTGKVPILEDDGNTIWESLSILEYLADKYPEKNLWPQNLQDKTYARCIANEMHAGFMALRAACPMNMRRKIESIDIDAGVIKDIKRIEYIWQDCLNKSGGPFLFGDYSIADGMFAPIVNRFWIYKLSDHPYVKKYSDTMMSIPAWQAWAKDSADESWVVDIDEVYRS